jgi:hypothetical protein
MKLAHWDDTQSAGGPGYMLQLSEEEAIKTIQSLTNQLVAKSPNTGRWETKLDSDEWFSVAVTETK